MKNKKYKVEIPEGWYVDSEIHSSINEFDETFTKEIHFKPIKKKLPKTWEEFYNRGHDDLKGQIEVTGPMHYEFTALWKLVLLRDHYNDGWVPDWDEESIKYDICYYKCNIITGGSESEHEVLAFKTVALRDEFLTNFRELIKNAKPLL